MTVMIQNSNLIYLFTLSIITTKHNPNSSKPFKKKEKDFSKPIEETMNRTMLLTPESSAKSSSTTANSNSSSNTIESETKDSYDYYPGCRKDANCNCEICIASFNATLDLMPLSIQRSTLTKRSKGPPRTPVSFNPSILSTPKSSVTKSFTVSPPLNSTARMNFHEKVKRKKRDLGYGVIVMRLMLCLGVVFGLEFGVSWMVFGVLQPKLSVNSVRNLGEKSWHLKDLNGRLEFLKKELQFLGDKDVLSCSSPDSIWKINQDGLLLNSRCVLYKSMAEEVSIWGWPLQTAGLLTAEFSSRSYTILSGRVTEWRNGEVSYTIRKSNSSWIQDKWSASAVQLDPKTWILEYRQSFVMENARVISAVLRFLKFRLTREFGKMKQEFWLLLTSSGNLHTSFRGENFKTPT